MGRELIFVYVYSNRLIFDADNNKSKNINFSAFPPEIPS
jgi:hypothetical protein